MSHVYSTNVGPNILVIAYDGYISVNYVSDNGDITEGETVPLPSIEGYPLSVDDLITLDNQVVVLIGIQCRGPPWIGVCVTCYCYMRSKSTLKYSTAHPKKQERRPENL